VPIHKRLSRATLLAATLFVVALTPMRAAAATATKVLTNYETQTGRRLSRDCGYSTPLPTDPSQSFWLFCDTAQYDANGNPYPAAFPFWPGTFAAVGPSTPGVVPTTLNHLPTPPTVPTAANTQSPSLFLPNPANFTDNYGKPCSYSATWALGVSAGSAQPATLLNGTEAVQVADASKLLFVSYIQVCVASDPAGNWNGMDLIAKRFGVAAYDPATNKIVANSVVFSADAPGTRLPWQQQLFHPTFSGTYMYLYGYNCDNLFKPFAACLQGRASTVRVPLSGIHNAATYEYQTATGWTTDYNQAADVLGNVGLGTLALDVGDFTASGRGYLLMEQLTYGGHYKLWQSSSPTGPWTKVRDGVMPNCPTGVGGGCYHLWSHAELSTNDKLMYSFYDIKRAEVVLTEIDNVPTLP
jgi:hypothetical protein